MLVNNLIQNLKNKKTSFTGIHGYENSVIPQLERAILSQHNINFLGLRGQAKTRLARLRVQLGDVVSPIIGGSEIDFAYGVTELNDGTPVIVGDSSSSCIDIPDNKGFTDVLIIKMK